MHPITVYNIPGLYTCAAGNVFNVWCITIVVIS